MTPIVKATSTVNTSLLKGRKIKYIVIHYTAGVTSKKGSARNTAAYFSRAAAKASADFIVDDAEIVQFNPDIRNRYCWHAGSSIGKYKTKGGSLYKIATSANSIGIEVCSTNRTGKITTANDGYWSFTGAVLERAEELVRYLMAEYGIDADHVIRHYDVTGKLCPGIVGWNADSGSEAQWKAFKARLTAKPMEVKKEEEPMTGKEILSALTDEEAYELLTKAQRYAGKLAEPEWSRKEGRWKGMKEVGFMDGERPEAFVKRCEMAAVLGRLIKLE